jgi:hypothetical protein
MSVLPLGLALLPGAAATAGGTKVMNDVLIQPDPANPSQSIASGAEGAARSNPSFGPAQTKEMGCLVTTYAGTAVSPAGSSVTCLATKGTQQLACWSADPGIVSTALGISGDSTVTFEAAPATAGSPPNECVSLFVENSSKFLPKSP